GLTVAVNVTAWPTTEAPGELTVVVVSVLVLNAAICPRQPSGALPTVMLVLFPEELVFLSADVWATLCAPVAPPFTVPVGASRTKPFVIEPVLNVREAEPELVESPAISRSVADVGATVPDDTVVLEPVLDPLPPAVRFEPSKGLLDATTL